MEATCRGASYLSLAWIVEGWLVWRWGGGWLLALFAVLVIPGGFFALAWGERLRRLYREGRALLRLLVDRDLGRHLGERRRAILDEMDRAVARVPESVLAGREEGGGGGGGGGGGRGGGEEGWGGLRRVGGGGGGGQGQRVGGPPGMQASVVAGKGRVWACLGIQAGGNQGRHPGHRVFLGRAAP